MNPRQSQGVVPPPGMNLPPPPGVVQQQQLPPQPIMPNAADDPFGAMNAMAAVGQVHRAPEMIIVNDGKPVENVGQQSRGQTIAKIAVPAVVALLVGLGIGRRSQAADTYNSGIASAKDILGNTSNRASSAPSTVAALKRTISDVDSALDAAAQKGFPYDPELDKQLDTLVGKLDVKSDVVFAKIKSNAINDATAAKIVGFYAGVAELKSMVGTHTTAARADAKMFQKAKDKKEAAAAKPTDNQYLYGKPRYGIIVTGPTEGNANTPVGAQLVEIGPPYCGPTASNPTSSGVCPDNDPSAFSYRAEPGVNWSRGELPPPGTKIPVQRLLTLDDSAIGDALIGGAEGEASDVYYRRRLRAIYEYVHGKEDKSTVGLLGSANSVEQLLSAESSKGTQFAFFL